MSTSSIGRWLIAVLIPLGIWAASVVPAEIVFRLLGRQPADTILGYYAPFGEKGFRLKPHADTRFNWWSGPFSVRTDGLGLRIPDAADSKTYRPKPNERIWLAIGDSQGFGNGVPYEQSVVGRVAARARDGGVFIRNLAVGGHTLPNQIELLKWFVEHTERPGERLLVFLTPRMVGSPDQYVTAFVQDGEIFDRAPTNEMLLRLYLRSYSAAYLTLRDAIKTIDRPDKPDYRGNLPFYDDERMDEARYARFRERMVELKTWAAERDIELSLAYLPFAVGVQIDHGLIPSTSDLNTSAPWDFAQRVAQDLDVPIVTIRPAMDAFLEAGKPISLRGDSHYNPEMSAAAADLLYDALVSPDLDRSPEDHKEPPE